MNNDLRHTLRICAICGVDETLPFKDDEFDYDRMKFNESVVCGWRLTTLYIKGEQADRDYCPDCYGLMESEVPNWPYPTEPPK